MKPARPPEAATFRSDPSLPGIELLHARYTAHQFAPHSHEAFAVGVVLSGALSFSYRSPSEVVPAGHIMIIHPGEVHTGRCVGGRGCAYCMLYATPKTVRSVFPGRNGATVDFPFFPNQTIDDPGLADRMVQLHSLLESPGASLLEKESRLISVLSMLVGRHARPRPSETPRRIDKAFTRTALELIEDRYSENISLRDLAERIPISPFHLLREFKKQYGLGPHAYLSQLRIRKAKQLLKGRAPLADIALQTGFCDQAQFTRRFKQIVGTTPGGYRQQQ
jgi:AraC-like DNA-binding protein/mannose-6-phosphate isomerase-like protein (cupin superfamily)